MTEGVELCDSEGVELGDFEGVELGNTEGVELCDSVGVELGDSEGVELGDSEGAKLASGFTGPHCPKDTTSSESNSPPENVSPLNVTEYSPSPNSQHKP